MSGPRETPAATASGSRSLLGAPPRFGLSRAVRALIVLVGISPLISALIHGVPGVGPVVAPLEAWFEFHCHRDPGRSLHFLGSVLPVCARCLGIYVGLALGAGVLYPRLGAWPLRLWVGGAALAMVADVATESWGLHPASTGLRVLTGLALAYPVGSTLVWAARDG